MINITNCLPKTELLSFQIIQKNESNIQLWTNYKQKHSKVTRVLEELTEDLSVSCIVPLGKRAMMKGKLTHTNEILVSIGDGYLIKCTKNQAISICERRMKSKLVE